MKKIAIITGRRAEYGYSKKIAKLLQKNPDFKVFLIVMNMHLLKKYGLSYKQIKDDGFKIDAVIKTKIKTDTPFEHTKTIGRCIYEMAKTFNKINPDLVLVSGDPWESFVGAVTASYMNIPFAHIQAGELSGNIDGVVRHAITKMAHLHFAANADAAERVEKMGEQKFRVFNVGAPLLDEVVDTSIDDEFLKELDFNLSEPIIMVLQHPVSLENKDAGNQMKETMKAVDELKLQTVVIYPNNEPGSEDIIKVIEEYKNRNYIRIFKNLPRRKYVTLLKTAKVLVGNSSSGILEAPTFKLPAVQIGTREEGRFRASNILDVKYHKKELIVDAIKKALYDKKFKEDLKKCKNPYGDGKSSERIVSILERTEIDDKLLRKNMVY